MKSLPLALVIAFGPSNNNHLGGFGDSIEILSMNLNGIATMIKLFDCKVFIAHLGSAS